MTETTNVVVKKLAEFKNRHVNFIIARVEDSDQYVAVAMQGINRITLAGDKRQMEYFLATALNAVHEDK